MVAYAMRSVSIIAVSTIAAFAMRSVSIMTVYAISSVSIYSSLWGQFLLL